MPLTRAQRRSAEAIRVAIRARAAPPAEIRRAFDAVPREMRDAWLDAVLGVDAIPDDGPELPPGGVGYLPCPADALLEAFDRAALSPDDVLVDLGAGLGRVILAARVLAGAAAIGVEIQRALVDRGCAGIDALALDRCTIVQGDAAAHVPTGSVYFLYCPFGGARLEAALDAIAGQASARPVRVITVDVPLRRAGFEVVGPQDGSVVVYRVGPAGAVEPRAPAARDT